MARAEISRDDLTSQLLALGVTPGGVLLMHTSYKAIGPIAGGPMGLLDAVLAALGPEGTLILPSWTGDDQTPFDPQTTPSSPDLGVVPQLFWQRPGVLRSAHEFAFAATGPRAPELLADGLPLPPHGPASPVGRVHEADGQVLLLGVGHDANTTMHLAELLAGVPYGVPKQITTRRDGTPMRLEYRENDHCCARFEQMDGWLRQQGLQGEGPVGHGTARLVRARDVVRVATAELARNPLVFLHEAEHCADCKEARASIVA